MLHRKVIKSLMRINEESFISGIRSRPRKNFFVQVSSYAGDIRVVNIGLYA